MPKRHKISEEQIAELNQARKETKDKKVDKRLKALLLHSEGMGHEKIAEQTEFAKTYISELVCKYCTKGLSTIADNHYQGNRRNLSFAEEEAFLATFKKAAESGQIVEVSTIKVAYEEKIRRTVNSNGLIYELLKRHGWRKIMPRSKHPNKASDEAIEASKKLTLKSGN